MNKTEFRKLFDDKILILDGATGTNLMDAGMPLGVCPEQWILEHKQIMIDLQTAYLNAGTDILYAPTFTCNRIKLNEYGLADNLVSMNSELVKLSQKAVENAGHGLVAGDITMTGEMLYPMGKLQFEELVDVYKEQIKVLDESGCDLLVVETMMSLAETRAAVIAANEVSKLPIIASLTFNEDGRTLYGTDPVTAVNVLQNLGVAAIGVNCSTGPDKMVELVKQMKSIAFIPVFAKPNAGMPELVDDKSVYKMTPEEFAADMKLIIEAGAGMVGGCCGTRPDHIKALSDMAATVPVPKISSEHVRCISSERSSLVIDLDAPFKVVGERINPTGKKKLQAELREGSLELVMNMAEEILPLVRKYGAMFILLPLSDKGLPESSQEKEDIINTVLGTAYDLGFTKKDVVVDGLVATIGAQKDAAVNCLRTINYCYSNGLATICGLSNISFGLPERMFVNTAFLTMAIERGLTMAIANPSQTMLMNAAYASDMLLFKEDSDVRYIENVKALDIAAPGAGASGGKAGADLEGKSQIYIDVLKGNKRTILDDVNAVLASGADPQSIIDDDLIGVISPLVLKGKDSSNMPTIVVATVEGDIHDIGKNLVVLMLRNYGFNVIDLGKDVPCDVIIQAAKENNASIIGLSALMTTTMVKMKDVVEAVRENGLDRKVIIGGAVITESYADEIGADGYSGDAADCVALVKKLLGIE